MANVVELLKTVKLFEGLSQKDLASLAELFDERSCEPGILVVEEGAVGDEFFIVKSGSVNITRGVGGKQVFLTALGPGDAFGEAALFNDIKRTASATAMAKVELLVVDKKKFNDYLNKNSVAATRILMQMLQDIFLRLQQTSADLQFRHKEGLGQDEIDKILKIFTS